MEEVVKQPKERPNSKRSNQLDKKCFKCHDYGHFQANYSNRKVMTLREIEKAYQGIEDEDDEKHDDLANCEEEEEVIEEVDNGNILVLMGALHVQNNPNKDQRLNIFQARFTINTKVCSIIEDSGSYANVAFTTLGEASITFIIITSPVQALMAKQ